MKNYDITVKRHFAAAHFLRGYAGSCADLHGHNWIVTVSVRATELDEIGMGIDFRKLRKMVEETLSHLDHKNLNDLAHFQEYNPTAENIASYLYAQLQSKVGGNGRKLARITVEESPGNEVTYWED